MWQRFTERARKVVFYAQEEAQLYGKGYVSTEHLLLGLCRDTDSIAARVLETLGVSLNRVRAETEKQLPRGDARPSQDMTLTPRAKRVIDLAYDEARNLSNDYIGTEHLLLGLIREGDGLAGRVLAKLGAELHKARRVVEEIQTGEPREPKPQVKGVETISKMVSKLRGRGNGQEDPRAAIRAKLVFVVGIKSIVEGFSSFLRSLGLVPLTWDDAWKLTSTSVPTLGDVVNTAFAVGGAIVFVIGPESTDGQGDVAESDLDFRDKIFAAGAALALEPSRTLLLATENVDLTQALHLHCLRIDDTPECRASIVGVLKGAGCPADNSGEDWLTAGSLVEPPSAA